MIEQASSILDLLHARSDLLGLILITLAVISMERLNTKIAIVIERLNIHEKRLDKLEDKK